MIDARWACYECAATMLETMLVPISRLEQNESLSITTRLRATKSFTDASLTTGETPVKIRGESLMRLPTCWPRRAGRQEARAPDAKHTERTS